MTDQQQSPFIGQVWQRRNDWWRYVVMLFAIWIVDKVSELFLVSLMGGTEVGYSFSYVLSSFLGLGAILILFQPLHQAPIKSLFSVFKRVRPQHVLWGFIAGLFVFSSDPILNIFLSDIQSVSWLDNPGDFLKALLAGVVLGTGYASVSVIQLGYLFPALIKWLKRPLAAIALVWVYSNINYIQYLLVLGDRDFVSWSNFQFVFYSIPLFLMLGAWALMDDSIELIFGLMIGSSIVNNVFIKLGNGVGSWGQTVVEVSLENDALNYWAGNLVRTLFLLLVTIILYQKIPWNNWRSRLLSRYDKPAIHDEWKGRIDEIGLKNEE